MDIIKSAFFKVVLATVQRVAEVRRVGPPEE